MRVPLPCLCLRDQHMALSPDFTLATFDLPMLMGAVLERQAAAAADSSVDGGACMDFGQRAAEVQVRVRGV